MRIEKIELSNIYGHEKAQLDLSGITGAVIVGANGAGKSSLIDGALFALFGRAVVRGGSLANIVRAGAVVGGARLDFSLEGVRYQIERTYSRRTKAGASSVALRRYDLAAGEWRDAADAGDVRSVDAQIEALLGLDARAFLASSVMRQGDAASFSAQTPGDKLASLASLVGADKLRAAESLANAQRRELAAQRRELEARAATIEAARDKLDNRERELERLTASAEEAARAEEAAAVDLAAYVEREAAAREAFHATDRAAVVARGAADSAARAVERNAAHAARLAQLREERARAEEESDRALPDAPDAAAYNRTRGDWLAAAAAASGAQSLAEMLRYTKRPDIGPTRAQLLAQLGELRAEELTIRTALDAWRRLREAIEKDGDALRTLDAAHARHIATARASADALRKRPAACDMDFCGLIAPALLARDELARLEATDPASELRAQLAQRQGELAQLAQTFAPYGGREAAAQYVEGIDDKASPIEEEIEAAEERERQRAAHAKLEAQLREMGDPVELERVASELADAVKAAEEARAARATAAAASLAAATRAREISEELDRAEREAVARELGDGAKLAEEAARAEEEAAAALASVEPAREEAKRLVLELNAAQNRAFAARAARSSAEGLRSMCAGQVEELRGIVEAGAASLAQLASLRAEEIEAQLAHDFLRAAPQMLVASALARIEAGANEVLEEIAPGVRVRIERQRELKTGAARDEITILVERDGAARDLDTFSGGERFRIDVAIRLALARAASARSTAPAIQTLIVDEGWGSLDAEGVAALKDAFARLRQRFALILVVTHVQDVIDLFGTVIEVSRSGSDTQITVY